MDPLLFTCKSSLDRGTRTKTILVALVIMMVCLLGLILPDRTGKIFPVFVSGFVFLLYAVALAYGILNTPYAYSITKEYLEVKKRFNPLRIPIAEIKNIREFNTDDRKGLYRKFGTEGVLGNLGHYASKLHSHLMVFTSRDTHWALVVTRSGKKYVISPDDMLLIAATRELLGATP